MNLKIVKIVKDYLCVKILYEGHIIFPETRENKLVFSYTPCRFQKKAIEAQENKDTGEKEIKNARMKNIDVTDKNRVKLIKWLKNFMIIMIHIKI
jgi:hypothetical protein